MSKIESNRPLGVSENETEVFMLVLDKILGPEGDVWGWYPKADRVGKDGKPKYADFVIFGCTQVYRGGYQTFGEADIEARMNIINAKIDALSNTVMASICVRDLDADPPVYGGACASNSDDNCIIWFYAGSGAPELVDHLLICEFQLMCGKITEDDYALRTDLDYPGIKSAMEKAGMHAGVYMAMKVGIEARFRNAFAQIVG